MRDRLSSAARSPGSWHRRLATVNSGVLRGGPQVRESDHCFAVRNGPGTARCPAEGPGPHLHPRGAALPRRGPVVPRGEPARRHAPQGAGGAPRPARGHGGVAANPLPQGMGRAQLAHRVRRHRLGPGPAVHLRGGVRRRRHAPPAPLRPEDGRAGDPALRRCRAARPLPPPHPLRRGLVVPGLLRARVGLGPGLAAHPRGAGGGPLRGERPEDLDHAGPARRLDLLPGPHRPNRQGPGRDLLPAHRHEVAGGDGSPHHHAGRWARGERGLVRGREGPGREPGRRGEQGLDLRQVPPRPRAGQHRRHRHLQAGDSSG